MPLFLLTTLCIVAMLLVCIEFGRRARRRTSAEKWSSGLNVVDGAVFGLLALLLGFSFSGALTRFDMRRQLIVEEANAIRSAYLRVDLLPEAAQPQIREEFRAYLDARLGFYREMVSNRTNAMTYYATAEQLQKKLWADSIAAAKQTSYLPLIAASLNVMFDITTTRYVALQTHPPVLIYTTLIVLALASALIAGFTMGDTGRRPWMHSLVYAVALTITVYTIIDLEFPRLGLIRIDRYDQVLIHERNDMN